MVRPERRGQASDSSLGLNLDIFAREDGTFPTPLINVVASQGVAEDTIGRLADASPDDLPLAFGDIDKRCELADGTPLHPAFLLATLGVTHSRGGPTALANGNIKCGPDNKAKGNRHEKQAA